MSSSIEVVKVLPPSGDVFVFEDDDVDAESAPKRGAARGPSPPLVVVRAADGEPQFGHGSNQAESTDDDDSDA
jgi:hypothetical protein